MTRLAGRVALVTGAASGIGKAVAERLREEGAEVIAADIAGDADIVRLDVRSEDSWRDAMAVAAGKGRLDILVNNAGILREAPVEDTPKEMWDDILAVNLTGTFLGCKHAVPMLAEAGGGAIVNLSSINALTGSHDHVAYAATKGGIASLTRALAVELADRGIRVNAVAPGTVDTPLVAALAANAADPAAGEAARLAMHPLGRISSPEEQAAAIAFLCGPDASFITGVVLPVDGGRAIR